MMRLVRLLSLLALVPALQGCGLGGCVKDNGDSCVGPGDQPSPPDMATGPTCPTSCGACGASEECITPAPVTQDHAFCAAGCADDRDCAAGARCLTLFAAMAPSACVPNALAIGCGDWSKEVCDTQPSCDGNVALQPFSDAARGLCAWERVFCANGCTNGICN